MKKAMIDLNVILDVVQKRDPHFPASAQILAKTHRGMYKAYLPAHALTTIHYISEKYAGTDKANQTVDWLLTSFNVVATGKREFLRARATDMVDFEDSVVAVAALTAECRFIVTRNVEDFDKAPITALTPEEWLSELGNED